MNSLSELRMRYIFSRHKEFTTTNLLKYINTIDKQKNPIIITGNLLQEAHFNSEYSFSNLQSYINYVTDQFCKLRPTSFIEKQWINFYFLLSVLRYQQEYVEAIYTQYKGLPKISTLIEEQQIIAQRMMPYYITKNLDFSELQEIQYNQN